MTNGSEHGEGEPTEQGAGEHEPASQVERLQTALAAILHDATSPTVLRNGVAPLVTTFEGHMITTARVNRQMTYWEYANVPPHILSRAAATVHLHQVANRDHRAFIGQGGKPALTITAISAEHSAGRHESPTYHLFVPSNMSGDIELMQGAHDAGIDPDNPVILDTQTGQYYTDTIPPALEELWNAAQDPIL